MVGEDCSECSAPPLDELLLISTQESMVGDPAVIKIPPPHKARGNPQLVPKPFWMVNPETRAPDPGASTRTTQL